MKKSTFLGQLDFCMQKAPEISVKLGKGDKVSRIFSNLHTKCEVFVFFCGSSSYIIMQ